MREKKTHRPRDEPFLVPWKLFLQGTTRFVYKSLNKQFLSSESVFGWSAFPIKYQEKFIRDQRRVQGRLRAILFFLLQEFLYM